VVNVDPLAEDQVRQLVFEMGHISSPDLGDRFSRRIFTVTKGNVFYMMEVLKALFEQRVLTVAENGEWVLGSEVRASDFQMPPTIRRAMEQRLQSLPAVLRDLLTTIAVGRVACSVKLISEVTHLPRLEVATLCDELVGCHLLIEEDGTFQPAHPMVADVIRRGLSPARMAELNRAFALGLDTVTPADARPALAGRIARHADRGGVPQLATQAAIEASLDAVQRFAFEEALSWLDLAARQATDEKAVEEVDTLTAKVLALAGWNEAPATPSGKDSMVQRMETADFDLREAEDHQD